MNLIQPAGKLQVLPERIGRLNELAYNLWWTWHPEAQRLFSEVDSVLWEAVYHSPVRFLNEVRRRSLDAATERAEYVELYDSVMSNFDKYLAAGDTWYGTNHADATGPIAYFSFEFGLHESLPIYSGGLGVLAGDHVKGASDLGVPMVFVGYLYPQGYFRQIINHDGWQEAEYPKFDFDDKPVLPAQTPDGREVIVSVELPGRTVFAKVYRFQVGRVSIYMLDTDIHPNAPADRELSSRLYGGDQEMRVAQEMVLGIGGVRALRQLGIAPRAWHMNEGHSAFLLLELARERVEQGEQFEQALDSVAASTVFTTHTPVAAGNDAFNFELISKYFSDYAPLLGITKEQLFDVAKEGQPWGHAFSMTALALRGSTYHNGVSQLHGRVSRNMWHWLYPNVPVDQVPIASITNGVHTGSWLASDLHGFFNTYLGEGWYDRLDDPDVWQPLYQASDQELWEIHLRLKRELVHFTRLRMDAWYKRNGSPSDVSNLFDPEALTIGFARRFATYKRATLIFTDVGRLMSIINNSDRPVQMVFAGKAHPKDEPGKHFIQQVNWAARHDGLRGKIIFLEEYDMNVARYLVQGVDVWLNNPRRPYEASGTSGMKAALNGVPNFSVLDGWWAEGYNGKNGWAIGEGQEYGNPGEQDHHDVVSLYNTLESQIVPAYYARNEQGVPTEWTRLMKEAIVSCAPTFSMHRQVKEYTEMFYLPAMRASGT
ncbi:MAG TPA: alpha-glucan family phosphorylase [Chloroflexia bacterium]